MKIDLLFTGFPGRTDRGYLGWSSCVLIRGEGKRPILFDTAGFNERVVLLEKLAALGVRPRDIESVFLSHFHFNHVANYSLFPNATFYLHEREIEYVETHGREDLAVPYELFPALKNSGRLTVLSGCGGIENGLKWIHTPGHTPGMYSIFLESQGERWVLASDAVINRSELVTGEAATSKDPVSSRTSIQTIRTWAEVVVPGHDGPVRIHRDGDQIAVHSISKPSVEVMLPVGEDLQEKTLILET